jgi:hypothetical protein
MRVLLLLVLLAGVIGSASYVARLRYPTETVKVPGSTRTYQIVRGPDQCWDKDCYLSLVFLTKGTDRATWRAEASATTMSSRNRRLPGSVPSWALRAW